MPNIPQLLNALPQLLSHKAAGVGSAKSGPLSGMGMKISVEDARDLLRRLHDENSLVQAIFTSPHGVSSVLRGVLRLPVHDMLWAVKSHQESVGSALSFDLSSMTQRMYGDERSMQGDSAFPFRFSYTSALLFEFKDGSRLSLFELDED